MISANMYFNSRSRTPHHVHIRDGTMFITPSGKENVMKNNRRDRDV